MTADPGRKALDEIDKVLSASPKKDDHAFSKATICLAKFRDEINRGQDRVRHFNKGRTITIVVGMSAAAVIRGLELSFPHETLLNPKARIRLVGCRYSISFFIT